MVCRSACVYKERKNKKQSTVRLRYMNYNAQLSLRLLISLVYKSYSKTTLHVPPKALGNSWILGWHEMSKVTTILTGHKFVAIKISGSKPVKKTPNLTQLDLNSQSMPVAPSIHEFETKQSKLKPPRLSKS